VRHARGEQLQGVDAVEVIVTVAELAIDLDRPFVLQDGRDLLRAQGTQGILDPLPAAAAAEGDGLGVEQADRFLVEQPVEQSFRR
jgi:hypothetical protein